MPGKLRIKHLETDSLVPYARNARTHSDAQVAQIAASIEEFGWTNPVLVDGQGGIIAGHGRVAFARTMPQGVFRTLSYCCAAPSSPAPPRSPGHHARRRAPWAQRHPHDGDPFRSRNAITAHVLLHRRLVLTP